MIKTNEKFINPFTDFGFKKIFGKESNKDLLMDFLNELIRQNKSSIVSLIHYKNEQLSHNANDCRSIFEAICKPENGKTFMVGMQRIQKGYFKSSLRHSTPPIILQEQEERDRNLNIDTVCVVALFDFVFNEDEHEKDKYFYDIQLIDTETREVFDDKLRFVYIEMPKFDKPLSQCETRIEKWLYVLKNMAQLEHMPEELEDKIFKKLFGEAELANYSPKEYEAYTSSLKIYWENYSTI